MFWGLLGVGLALGGTGVPLIAMPGTGFWGIVGWALSLAGLFSLVAAAVVGTRRYRTAPATTGISAEAILEKGSSVEGSVVGNVIQHSTVTVAPAEPVTGPAEPPKEILDVKPSYLAGFFENHTSIQAAKLLAPYLGKWLRVSGKLDDVDSPPHFPGVFVTFQYEPDDPDNHVHLVFPQEAEARLELIPRGTEITVIGKIADASTFSVVLHECELEDR